MIDWGDTGRRMGPTPEPKPGADDQSAPDSTDVEPERPAVSAADVSRGTALHRDAPIGVAGGTEEPAAGLVPEDDFDPRYCTMCHRRIPVAVSDRQGVCDECLRALKAVGAAPEPETALLPKCPNCGSRQVRDEWVTDWLTTAVDVVSEGIDLLASYGVGYNTGDGTGVVKVLRHRCEDCGYRWKSDGADYKG